MVVLFFLPTTPQFDEGDYKRIEQEKQQKSLGDGLFNIF
jgi:hypothetical protein